MNPWLDIQVKHEQNKDLLRTIEQRRLVAAARAGKPPIVVLARVGRWLIAAGHSLEARFGARTTPPAFTDM